MWPFKGPPQDDDLERAKTEQKQAQERLNDQLRKRDLLEDFLQERLKEKRNG